MAQLFDRLNQEVLDEDDLSYIEELEMERLQALTEGRAEGRAGGFEQGLKIGEARGEGNW